MGADRRHPARDGTGVAKARAIQAEAARLIGNHLAALHPACQPLSTPVTVKEVRTQNATGKVKLCSFETYFVINQAIAVRAGEKPRRRFVQLRGVVDAFVSAKVHNIELLEGEWFGREGGVSVGI